MEKEHRELNVAIVGGGKACKAFLQLSLGQIIRHLKMNILGVADINDEAEGLRYARLNGIFATKDYRDFYRIKNMDLIIELTGDYELRDAIVNSKPSHVQLIDHKMAWIFWDIIEGEKILREQEELLESYQFAKAITDNSPDDIMVVDRDYNIRDANQKLIERKGLSKRDMLGRHCYEVYAHEACLSSVGLCPLSETCKTGEPYKTVHTFSAKDEGLRYFRITTYPIKDDRGLVTYVVIIGRDITEKVKTQEELKRSEERYRCLFNADPNPIFIIDKETLKILDANNRATESYRYTKTELTQMSLMDLEHEKDRSIVDSLIGIKDNQSAFFPKRRHLRKDKNPFYVNVHISSATCPVMERDVLIATTTDVTESIEKEAQLIQASKMVSMGTMASGIAHELNQPLSVIKIGSNLLVKMADKGDKIDKEELKIISDEMGDQVDRASAIINHMRSFSRPSPGMKSTVDINDPIKDVFKVLGQQLKVHGVEVDLVLGENLFVMADHNRLEQVIMNLVSNAVDAMDEKEQKLGREGWKKSLKMRSFPDNEYVVVTVSDTGVGIPEEMMDKIFEPFFTTKEPGKGTGLGMCISYGIVRDYQGTIEVESIAGEGTTIKLRFPAYKYSEHKSVEAFTH